MISSKGNRRASPTELDDANSMPSSPLSPPGRGPLALAALAVGLLLMAIQLWLLTVALELLLSGHGREAWPLALISGLIFCGGLGILWLLRSHPRLRSGPPLQELA